jgi:ATP-dependent Lhr-like helicase
MASASTVFRWFRKTYGDPTPAQAAAWPCIQAGENVLIASPTGTGKTFAAFLCVIDALAQRHRAGELSDAIHCVYVSPLRALSYDLEKNLNGPLRELFGEKPPIRVELRTGDTTSHIRARQYVKPPHILLTTPESLCLLLSQEKWLPHLAQARWLIVDEIHAMAENKRGAHLSLSIERLADLPRLMKQSEPRPLQRVGLSATIAPLPEVAQFLVGTHGRCAIIDVTTKKRLELRVHSPLRKNPYPEAGYTGERLVKELGELIKKHQTTLVFCNTRSGAEGVSFWLRQSFPELAEQIECHHASLEREVRLEVEDRLKRGELRAVVCSTSLELGIDIGSVELVVMMSTPKGVSKALQRAGRAGHNIHSVSRGILMATNVSDLVESCATVLLARQHRLDDVRIPQNALDVLAQHLVSMGCISWWSKPEALALVRRAHPFRTLSDAEFDDVIDYLAGGGVSLRRQYTEVFGKIEIDGDLFRTRPGRVQRDFLQNVGVIPNVGQVRVRSKSRALGSVEESFIRQLRIGDIFVLTGRAVQLDKISQMEAWVTPRLGATPTVPRWNANKFPLSNRVCEEIVAFRSELRARFEQRGSEDPSNAEWIAKRLDCGVANARILHAMHAAQNQISEIPTADSLLVEELIEYESESARRKRRGKTPKPVARHYFFHSLIGRAANDALSRAVVSRLHQLRGGNAISTPHDYGFVLTVTLGQSFTESEIPHLLDPRAFDAALSDALRQSEMLRYHFRNAAQTGLMVYRNLLGERRSVRKLTWSADVIFNVLQQHEPEHVLMREARRDTLHTFIDADAALAFLRAQRDRPVKLIRVEHVPPLSFAMYATKMKEAVMVEDPFEMQERLFHQWWSELQSASNV